MAPVTNALKYASSHSKVQNTEQVQQLNHCLDVLSSQQRFELWITHASVYDDRHIGATLKFVGEHLGQTEDVTCRSENL